MTTTSASPFSTFLATYSAWTLHIESSHRLRSKARTDKELIEALRVLDRGTSIVTLQIGEAMQGYAELTKLITGKLKEEKATRACIGIAAYYNDSLRGQGSEGDQ